MKLNKFKGFLISLTISMALLGAGAIKANSVHASHVPYQGHYYKLINRVHAAGASRRSYRYPTIATNARDLGGYHVKGTSYHVKRDAIIRSGNLSHINYNGAEKLRKLNVKHVIDLRYPYGKYGSIAQNPDPGELKAPNKYGLKLHYKYEPTYTYNQSLSTRPMKLRYGEIYRYGAPFSIYATARKSYHNILNNLIKPHKGAILINCTQGRDRTGIISAVILSALGVSKYNVYNDYLLTDYYIHKYSYRNQIEELNHFYNTINSTYGSMNNYIRKGLDFNSSKINKLRKMYLVK